MDLHAPEPRRPDVRQPDRQATCERPASTAQERDEPPDSLDAASLTIARLRRFIDGPDGR